MIFTDTGKGKKRRGPLADEALLGVSIFQEVSTTC